MIPLNKPKIYKNSPSNKNNSIEAILKSCFYNRSIELVFSARQGLDIIYQELFKKKGSCTVAVSPLTCFDALYPIINNKHTLVFVDVNPETFNMDEELIPNGIDIVQPIHFGGNPQNMDIIIQKSKLNSSIIVEDCAQAFGSTYKDINLGDFGDYASFSLVKNLYALGGGFILTKENINIPKLEESNLNLTIYRELKRFLESKNSYNSIFYERILLTLLKLKPKDTSYTFSKNSINNTMLRSIDLQLKNLESLVQERKKIAYRIRSEINNENLIEQKIHKNGKSNYTRLLYRLKKGNSKAYISILRKSKIWANHLSQNTLSDYQESVAKHQDFKKYANSDRLIQYNKLHDKIIAIPISPALNEKEIDYIIYHINKL